MKKTLLACTMFAMTASLPALAQDKAYLVTLLGVGNAQNTMSASQDSSLSEHKNRPAFELSAGINCNDYIAIESVYQYLAGYKATEGDSEGSFTGKYSTQILGARLLAKLPLTESLQTFLQGGLGLSYSAFKTSATNESTQRTHKWRLVPSLGVGADYALNKKWCLRAKYERIFRTSSETDCTPKNDYNVFLIGTKYTL